MPLGMFGQPAYAGAMYAFRSALVESGFIWIIWVVVATLTIAYVRELFWERRALHENLMILIYPFIIGLLSWIATGSAIVMALPVAAALVIPPLLKRGIRRAVQTGAAIRDFMRRRAREIREEEYLRSRDRTEEILARENLTLSEKKLHLLEELSGQAGFGIRNMAWAIKGLSEILRKQLGILRKEYKIEKAEEKKEKGEFKESKVLEKAETYMLREQFKEFKAILPVLARIAPISYRRLLGLIQKETVTEKGELKLDAILEREENKELRDVYSATRAFRRLKQILANQERLLEKITKARGLRAAALYIQKFIRLTQEEIPLWRTVLREERLAEQIEAQEEGISRRLYRNEALELTEEQMVWRFLGPLKRLVKAAARRL